MADDVREYVRAAQAAELRGEGAAAAELLWKAAQLCRSEGKPVRALGLLRHAQRLDAGRKDVAEEIRRLEWIPEQPMRAAIASDEALEEEMKRALAPLEDAALGAGDSPLPGQPRPLPDRGPTLADAAVGAWCSFCCKPSREVGALVAGPAGAFVCRACVTEAARLLGEAVRTETDRTETVRTETDRPETDRTETDRTESDRTETDRTEAVRPGSAASAASAPPAEQVLPELPEGTVARLLALAGGGAVEAGPAEESEEAPGAAAPSVLELPHQAQARREIDLALGWGRKRILLLGPPGSGKSTLLRALAAERRGLICTSASAPRSIPSDWLLLVDEGALSTEEGRQRVIQLWERHAGSSVLALSGQPAQPLAFLLTEDARVPWTTTRAILDAASGALPLDLAERVDAVVSLETGDEASKVLLATSLLRARGFAEEWVTEVVPRILEAAGERGAHEIVALVNRIPPGAWRLEAAAPGKPAKKRAKGKKAQG